MRFVRGLVGLAMLASPLPALAADLSVMPVKAPVMMAAVPGWTGLYAGLSLGARWADSTWHTTCLQEGMPGNVCPGTFPNLIAANNPAGFDSSSARIGIHLGYNWQIAHWIVGLEGDLAWADGKRQRRGIPGAEDPTVAGSPGDDFSRIKHGMDGSFRARAGYLMTPATLVYVTGGVSFLDVDTAAHCGTAFPVGWCSPANVVSTSSKSELRTGWTIGGGLEWLVRPNWTLRTEYRYADYGSSHVTLLQAPVAGVPNTDAVGADIKVRTHTALFGVSYRFGGR